jgi:hypothetical protein
VQRRRHLSVSPAYRWQTKLWLGIEPVVRGLWYISLILMGIFAHPITWAAALLLALVRGITLAVVINRGAQRLGERRFNPWRLWWYDLSMPVLTLSLMNGQGQKNPTW